MTTSVASTIDARTLSRMIHNPQNITEEPNRKTIRSEYGVSKWATNCNWIPDYKYADDERNDFYMATNGSNSLDFQRDGEPISFRELMNKFDLFDLRDYWASARIQVGVDKNSPRRWVYRSEAQGSDYRSIQINPKGYYRFMVIDIDRSDSKDIVLGNEYMPSPSFFVLDPYKGTGHAVYCIKNPVPHSDTWVKSKPYRYYRYVRSLVNKVLDGDPNYTGHFMKNPFSEDFITLWGSNSNVYSLSELENSANAALENMSDEDIVTISIDGKKVSQKHDLDRIKKQRDNAVKLEEQKHGRNKSMFDIARKWAYKNRHKAKSQSQWFDDVYAKCAECNVLLAQTDFADKGELHHSEVASTARSIAMWTWHNAQMSDHGTYSDKQRRKSIKTRQDRAFNTVVDEMRSTMQQLRKLKGKGYRFKIDRKNRVITLPENMTLREFKRLYRHLNGESIPQYTAAHLQENITDINEIRLSSEARRRKFSLRELRDLSREEQVEILSEVMVSPETYTTIQERHSLDNEVVKRLVAKYRRSPWSLMEDRISIDEEEKSALAHDANARWLNCVRNGGSIETPFFENPVELRDTSHDNVRLHEIEKARFEGIAQRITGLKPAPRNKDEKEMEDPIPFDRSEPSGILLFIKLLSKGFRLNRVAQRDFTIVESEPSWDNSDLFRPETEKSAVKARSQKNLSDRSDFIKKNYTLDSDLEMVDYANDVEFTEDGEA